MLWLPLVGEERQGEVIGLKPVSFFYDKDYQILLKQYYNSKDKYVRLYLLECILNLHRRVDKYLTTESYGVDIDDLSDEVLEQLSDLTLIEQLNDQPLPTNPPTSDDDIDHFPSWSSEDYVLDWTADLMFSLGDFQQVQLLFKTHTKAEVACIVKRLGDLHKGKEGREKEAAKDYYNSGEWLEDNPDAQSAYDDLFSFKNTPTNKANDSDTNTGKIKKQKNSSTKGSRTKGSSTRGSSNTSSKSSSQGAGKNPTSGSLADLNRRGEIYP